tara:strand:+ start:107 stop:331 length:225 start_codon:yes stop_codon:yes gene_type:complete
LYLERIINMAKGTISYEKLQRISKEMADELMANAVEAIDALGLERDPVLIIAYMQIVSDDYALMVAERRANGHA